MIVTYMKTYRKVVGCVTFLSHLFSCVETLSVADMAPTAPHWRACSLSHDVYSCGTCHQLLRLCALLS